MFSDLTVRLPIPHSSRGMLLCSHCRFRFLGGASRRPAHTAEADAQSGSGCPDRDGLVVFCWHGDVIHVCCFQVCAGFCVFYPALDAVFVTLSGDVQ